MKKGDKAEVIPIYKNHEENRAQMGPILIINIGVIYMLKRYPAIVHEEDGFWVEWPDLEGCSTCGETLEETFELAQEAMGLYIASLMEDGKSIPIVSKITSIHPDDGFVTYIATDVTKYIRNTRAVKET